MDLIMSKLEANAENEDEDYGSYFLQPASSPYNIAEKVQQANIDLFSSNVVAPMEKTSRVTFKDELTSYEPELLLTDDDVNSIESDPPENEIIEEENKQVLEYKSSNNIINLNIFDINEEEEEEEVEEAIEEIEPDDSDVEIKNDDNKESSFEEFNDYEETEKSDNLTVRISSSESKKSTKRKRTRKKSPSFKPSPSRNKTVVECKNHCIERLDFDLSMSIKKLEIHEKPINCPLLKLQRRKCCDENKAKNPTNLPCYNGFRSEYGLSSAELEKRERRKEIIKLKEEKRQQLMREYKNRKNQQNEAVFCQWLKDVAKRKTQKHKIDKFTNNNEKQCFSPNIISFPTKQVCGKNTERPNTANEFVPRHNIKRARRPHTSSCVFIEVPQNLLERGIHIGNLLVTNSNFSSKKMHIVAISS